MFLLIAGLCVVSTLPNSAMAENAHIAHKVSHGTYGAYIVEAAQRFRIPAAWIRAVMRVESAAYERAISPKGAMGLMQIMPDTWEDMRLRHRLGKDPFDPRNNIMAGAAYLRELHDRYGSPGFLAAYNAGPQRYEDYLSKKRPLPSETRAYVDSLLPVFGGSNMLDPIIVAATVPQKWSNSPLFASRKTRQSTIIPVQSEARADSVKEMSVRDISAIVPLSDGLFVPRFKSQQ